MTGRRNAEIRRTTTKFLEQSSLIGFPRIHSAGNAKSKAFWSIICILAVVICIWQVSELFVRYFQYQKSLSIELEANSATMPWVTLCNREPMNLWNQFVAAKYDEDIDKMINGVYLDEEDWENFKVVHDLEKRNRAVMAKLLKPLDKLYENDTIPLEKMDGSRHGQGGHLKTYLAFIQEFLKQYSSPQHNIYSLSPDTVKKSVGIKLDQLVALCMNLGDVCDFEKDFFQVLDPDFYNCYTYKGPSSDAAISEQSVPINEKTALSLVLFTGAGVQNPVQRYIEKNDMFLRFFDMKRHLFKSLFDSRGVRVIIHAPHTKANPMAHGVDIGPGLAATLKIKEEKTTRISTPIKPCMTDTNYTWDGTDYHFTYRNCQEQCVMDEVRSQCDCHVPDLYQDANQDEDLIACSHFETLESDLQNISSMWMSGDIEVAHEETKRMAMEISCPLITSYDTDTKQCECYLECNENGYTSLSSSSKWPKSSSTQPYAIFDDIFKLTNYSLIQDYESKGFMNRFSPIELDTLAEEQGVDMRKAANNSDDVRIQEEILSHFSVLNIYFSKTDVTITKESLDFTRVQLLSDIGGQLGLWIGLCIISFVEIIHFCWRIGLICAYPPKPKRNDTNAEDKGDSDAKMPLDGKIEEESEEGV